MAGLVALVALLAAGALYQLIGSTLQRRRLPPPGALVDVGGHRLHVFCRGRGSPPVLLESGIAASSLSWSRVQPAIAAFTEACAYDRAGLAWSDAASCPRTFDAIVDELAAVIAHGGSDRPRVLVGHSFGSLIVRGYAARHPRSVAGLVLVDPPTDWLAISPEQARRLRGATQLSRIGAALAHVGVVRACLALLTGGQPGAPRRFARLFGAQASSALERLVGEVRKLPPEVHPVVQAQWSQPKCFRAMGDYLGVLQREAAAIAALAPPPHIPITVISGGHQTPQDLAAQRGLAERSSRGRHLIAAHSGHWIPFDEPELIVSAVRELVDASA